MVINTQLLNLPCGVKGLSKANSDGTYTIILNSRLTYEQLQQTYLHEMEHIKRDDFHSTLTVDAIELKRGFRDA